MSEQRNATSLPEDPEKELERMRAENAALRASVHALRAHIADLGVRLNKDSLNSYVLAVRRQGISAPPQPT